MFPYSEYFYPIDVDYIANVLFLGERIDLFQIASRFLPLTVLSNFVKTSVAPVREYVEKSGSLRSVSGKIEVER